MECTTNPRTAYDKNTLCKLVRNFQVPNPLPFRILLTFRSNLQIERNKVSALPHWCGCSRNAWQPFLFKQITKVSLSVTLPWWNASPNPRNANLQLFCKLMKKIPKLLVLYLSKTSWHFRSNLKTEKEKSVCHCALWMLQQKLRRFCSSRSWTLSLSLSHPTSWHVSMLHSVMIVQCMHLRNRDYSSTPQTWPHTSFHDTKLA